MTYTNLTEEEIDRTLSCFHTRSHVLSQRSRYDLTTRTPAYGPAKDVGRELDDTSA